MIRTKGRAQDNLDGLQGGSTKDLREDRKVEVLPPQAPTETPAPSKHGQTRPSNGDGKPRNPHLHPGFVNNPYYCNPPDEYKWKPGQSGNPNGRPRIHLTMELINQLGEVDAKTGEPKFKAFIRKTIDKAMGEGVGNGTATQLIWERIEGVLKQKLEVSGTVAHIHTTMGELIQLANLTDAQLLAIEQVGLRALAVAEQEARERGEGDG